MGEYLKDVPEFIELDLGESLISRTESLGASSFPSRLSHSVLRRRRPLLSV